MRITSNDRAGHALRIRIAKLAEAVVAEQYRRRPELTERYGPAGRAHCLKDTAYALRFLAASVDFGQTRIFSDYVEWAVRVMASHGIDAADVVDNLHVLREVAAAHLPPEAVPAMLEHVDAAVSRLREETPAAPSPVTRPRG